MCPTDRDSHSYFSLPIGRIAYISGRRLLMFIPASHCRSCTLLHFPRRRFLVCRLHVAYIGSLASCPTSTCSRGSSGRASPGFERVPVRSPARGVGGPRHAAVVCFSVQKCVVLFLFDFSLIKHKRARCQVTKSTQIYLVTSENVTQTQECPLTLYQRKIFLLFLKSCSKRTVWF